MDSLRVVTQRLELRPLPPEAAEALPLDRGKASRDLNARVPDEWPQPDLLNVLPRQAAAFSGAECFGIWVMIEREGRAVVGDIGFHGPPDDQGAIEIGYCVVPSRRGRGYASEAARAMVEWASSRQNVRLIVAGCDPNNVPSICTLERAGFRRTGETNGQLRWRYDGEAVRS